MNYKWGYHSPFLEVVEEWVAKIQTKSSVCYYDPFFNNTYVWKFYEDFFLSFHRSIYLGETFMSYVSLHNDSTETSDNVVLKCDLQTATQRLPILQSAQG